MLVQEVTIFDSLAMASPLQLWGATGAVAVPAAQLRLRHPVHAMALNDLHLATAHGHQVALIVDAQDRVHLHPTWTYIIATLSG